MHEFGKTGRFDYRNAPGIVITAFVSLAAGGSLGPEAPLADACGGIGTWLSDRLKLDDSERRNLLFPAIPVAIAVAATMAGTLVAVLRAPLFAALFTMVLVQAETAPGIAVAVSALLMALLQLLAANRPGARAGGEPHPSPTNSAGGGGGLARSR